MDDISQWEVLLRVLVAGGLGALIGLERERTRRAAGVRTHTLVAVGSALLTASTILFMSENGGGAGEAVRIAAGIVTGVGFIGAGTILTSQGRVRGLTTAATVWVTAGIGITAGYGYLLLAALVAGPVTIAILLLGIGEKRLEETLEGFYEEPDEDEADESSSEAGRGGGGRPAGGPPRGPDGLTG
jgi:putative Mg2+ transporter-C (MgtC) family protein